MADRAVQEVALAAAMAELYRGEEHWGNDPEEMMRAALRAALGVLDRYRGPEPPCGAEADEQDDGMSDIDRSALNRMVPDQLSREEIEALETLFAEVELKGWILGKALVSARAKLRAYLGGTE